MTDLQTYPIDTYSLDGLKQLVAQYSQPAFRAQQVFAWLYGKGVTSYDAMTNLPASLRERLSVDAPLNFPSIESKRVSADGTRKYILRLADGQLIETVGIPSNSTPNNDEPRRLSVCVSSQVGCPMACAFCATGQEGFTRNLTPGEIVQQLLVVSADFEQRVSSVVVMGQGEPFLNYGAVLDALRIMNHPQGPNVGARHITVSTCGIAEKIRQLGREPEQFTLAVSLHSARQNIRDFLMPQCATNPLGALKDALHDYQAASGRRCTLEYLMMDGVNTQDADLQALIGFCHGLHVHVNLLPVNPIEGSTLAPCNSAYMHAWAQDLRNIGIEATVRTSRGSDIDGACGQLKNKRD